MIFESFRSILEFSDDFFYLSIR